MNAIAQPAASKAARWTGYAMSGLVILFLLFDGGIKLMPLQIVTATSAQIGLPTDASFARTLGVLTLIGVVPYAIPRTAVLGRSAGDYERPATIAAVPAITTALPRLA
jgi:hypothetical protein